MSENQRSNCRPCWHIAITFLLAFAGVTFVALRLAYPFLAANDPGRGGSLVVDGWLPDYSLSEAKEEYYRHSYDAVYTTGGPLEYGSFLTQYKTYAELGAATLIAMGLPKEVVHAIPAPPVARGRTYISANLLRQWFTANHIEPKMLTVMTLGPHARRTRMFYKKAFGDTPPVNVVGTDILDYDSSHWWRTSAGFRSVLTEGTAYLFSAFISIESGQ